MQVFRESCGGSWENFVVPDMRINPFGDLLTFIIATRGSRLVHQHSDLESYQAVYLRRAWLARSF
jgi:hypothetical protein